MRLEHLLSGELGQAASSQKLEARSYCNKNNHGLVRYQSYLFMLLKNVKLGASSLQLEADFELEYARALPEVALAESGL